MNLVSIIVPCYNQSQYLDECLQSVLDQTHSNWECIIVNDASTDDTDGVAKKWCDIDNRFRYIKQTNGGVSNARNNGISQSKGEYILPLDADDYVGLNYLEVCVNEMNAHNNVKLVYGKAIKFGEESGEWILSDYSFQNLLQRNMIFCTALFRRLDYDKTLGYDEEMRYSAEDWDFWICLLKNGGEVIKSNSCTFYYRIKNESRNSNLVKDSFKINKSYNHIFTKHHESYKVNNGIELHIKYSNLKLNLDNLDTYLSFKEVMKILLKKVNNYFK